MERMYLHNHSNFANLLTWVNSIEDTYRKHIEIDGQETIIGTKKIEEIWRNEETLSLV